MIYGGAPSAVHGPLKAYFRTPAIRWRALHAAGAIGLITITEPRNLPNGAANPQRASEPRGSRSTRPVEQLADPELWPLAGAKLSATVPDSSAAECFAGTQHTWDELQTLANNGQPLPAFPLPLRVHTRTETQVVSSYQAPNVIAKLEGSDPKLRNEYLILSAHLNQLGVGRPVDGDAIYNGVIDNAVGIASLIETAKALKAGPRPRRSLLFIAYTGEEEGELGSQFYARYPTVPRSQIIANLNMDMYLPLFSLHFLRKRGCRLRDRPQRAKARGGRAGARQPRRDNGPTDGVHCPRSQPTYRCPSVECRNRRALAHPSAAKFGKSQTVDRPCYR